ncbi:GD14105 [Drosophila simulans]|uniref:GD14105 n=1 Tax=Drosophila simulans TaxID=7240 RepID=B4QM46_DROSI|nr:GD14105 [Drosophila simulans]
MESKRSKKGRKSRPAESELPSNQQQEQQPHQHHPWDEDPSAKSPQANRAIPSTGTALTRFLTCMAPVIVESARLRRRPWAFDVATLACNQWRKCNTLVDPFEVEEE